MDADEVQAWKWVDVAQIYKEIDLHPDLYTSWLKAELNMLHEVLTRHSKNRDFHQNQ